MAQIQTYECDICHTVKKEVNHWWIGYLFSESIAIRPIIDITNVQALVHLCGFDCVTKWLHQQMQEIINRENALRTAGNDKKEV